MLHKNIPNIFKCLLSETCIDKHDILGTSDGFYMVHKSIASILATKSIFDFPDSSGESLACDKFFDDWFLYAIPNDLPQHLVFSCFHRKDLQDNQATFRFQMK